MDRTTLWQKASLDDATFLKRAALLLAIWLLVSLIISFARVTHPAFALQGDLSLHYHVTRSYARSFAEGTRTRDGFVHQFSPGVFRMAIQFGYPVVPMSIAGAFEFSRKGDWKLFPSQITVYLHDTIETSGLSKNDVEALMNKTRAIVATPVDEYYGCDAAADELSKPKVGVFG